MITKLISPERLADAIRVEDAIRILVSEHNTHFPDKSIFMLCGSAVNSLTSDQATPFRLGWAIDLDMVKEKLNLEEYKAYLLMYRVPPTGGPVFLDRVNVAAETLSRKQKTPLSNSIIDSPPAITAFNSQMQSLFVSEDRPSASLFLTGGIVGGSVEQQDFVNVNISFDIGGRSWMIYDELTDLTHEGVNEKALELIDHFWREAFARFHEKGRPTRVRVCRDAEGSVSFRGDNPWADGAQTPTQ